MKVTATDIKAKYYNSPARKTTYLEIPKSGCTSIIKYLKWPVKPNADDVPAYPVFTVVRNPVDRFLSGFNQLRKIKHAKGAETVDEFFKVIDKLGLYDRHIVPQSEFIRKHNGPIVIYSFDAFMRDISIHLNRSKYPKPILTDDQRQRIEEIYADDYYYL